MKLLFLAPRFPYPLEKGDKLRVYHLIRALSVHHEIILCALTDHAVSKEHRQELEAFCTAVYVLKLSWWRRLLRMTWSPLSSRPFQVHWFYQSNTSNQIRNLIAKEMPQQIFCNMIRTSEYVKDMHEIPRTLDYMDALSAGMRKRAQLHRGPAKWIFNWEGQKLARYEAAVLNYFDHQTIISKADRHLISHPDRKGIHVVPNGVDLRHFTSMASPWPLPAQAAGKTILLFTGNMAYAPNVRAAIRLKENILPLLHLGNFHLVIAGASPVPAVRQLAGESVSVTGWLDDIRSAYAIGDIFVAPLDIGTGLQNKILEAMASGLPCITTPNVAAGLPQTSLDSPPPVVVAEGDRDWAETIQRLSGDAEGRTMLARNGQQYVGESASWSAAAARLSTTFVT